MSTTHTTRNEKDLANNRLIAIVIAATVSRNRPLLGVKLIFFGPFRNGAK